MENKLSHVLEERRSVDLETQGLRNQLAKAQERVSASCGHTFMFMLEHLFLWSNCRRSLLFNCFLSSPLQVKTVDETCQAVNHQSSRLKADVRVLQKERDSLKREVTVLHKRLQNSNDKVRCFPSWSLNTLISMQVSSPYLEIRVQWS